MKRVESLRNTHPNFEVLSAPTTEMDAKRMARQAMRELLRVRAILAQISEHNSRKSKLQ